MKITAAKTTLTVAGIMSGTSADGIDIALVRIRDGADSIPSLKLIAHEAFPFPAALRKAVLAAMNAQDTFTSELARLNWRLGLAYAEALKSAVDRNQVKLDLVGCHGQTLYHQAEQLKYAGRTFACTWQAGEPSMLAQATGVPVVSNFRPADMVAGGQGAPLVPLLDYVLFRHASRGRVLQNIGGIGNLTSIPPSSNSEQVRAFDTGPGNMIIDALMLALFQKQYDAGGTVASKGQVLTPVVERALRTSFFRKLPPKSCGREEFGREYASKFLSECQKLSKRKQDAIATATALTAASVTNAYLSFVGERMGEATVDYVVSGGGVRNLTLMRMLTESLAPHKCKVTSIDRFGMPAQAKEAAAFALLAWQTWMRRPGNLPSATGANRPAILGQVTYV
jgi:anhydro-N-acetylmuramic acid kinase